MKPNIVFLFSDQHRADTLGCAGHAHVKTPNLDRLAASGTRFERTYAASPLCGPCRSALLTGQTVANCGALTHGHMRRDMGLPTMGTLFRDAGYVTGAFGKVHAAGEDDDRDLGFSERALRIFTFMKNDYQHTIGLEKFWQYCSYMPQYKPSPEAKQRHDYNLSNKPIELEDELILDSMTADRSIEFLKEHREEPFFLWVGLEKPHPEMYAPKRFHEMYNPEDMELPENRYFDRSRLPDTIIDNPIFPIADGRDDDEMRNDMAAYFANVSYMDEQAGRVLDTLDELGLRDNTIVVYSTDHGENLFNHQIIQKHCFFEEAVRVPLILRIPGVTEEGTIRDQLASLLDLLPTFCDACGITPPANLDGQSLLPTIRENTPLRDEVFSEFYAYGTPERMIRTERWKYVHSEGDLHQLYDLKNDPQEDINLIDDPDYREICKDLDARLCRYWEMPDTSDIPKRRGDTRPGQKRFVPSVS
ncbi:MAG: sulfatase-like hydrolase/transferase [Planctomycetes bacterium]|nr:sulfatase-like hydrolase/transferase [Planctomycetota bacterium]